MTLILAVLILSAYVSAQTHLSSVVDLQCTTTWVWKPYICSVVDLDEDFSTQKIRLVPASEDEIRQIEFRNVRIGKIPDHILSELPRINRLEVTNGSLSDLSGLSGSELRQLDIFQNEIHALSNDTFQQLPKLEHLNFRENGLRLIQNGCFDRLKHLMTLDMSMNDIEHLPSDFLLDTNVNIVKFSRNLLTNIDQKFSNLIYLQTLRLDGNKINKISSDSFENLPSLSYIVLADNELEFFDPETFVALPGLRYLDLDNNKLSKFELKLVMPSFSFATINYNQITELSVCTNLNHTEIDDLEARHNRISELIFKGNITMRNLYLSNNSLTDLSNLTKLNDLDKLLVRNNPIKDLSPLKSMNLKKLSLKSVNLTNDQVKSLLESSSLVYLDISCNQVELRTWNESKLNQLEYLELNGLGLKSIDLPRLKELFPKLGFVSLFGNDFGSENGEEIMDKALEVGILAVNEHIGGLPRAYDCHTSSPEPLNI